MLSAAQDNNNSFYNGGAHVATRSWTKSHKDLISDKFADRFARLPSWAKSLFSAMTEDINRLGEQLADAHERICQLEDAAAPIPDALAELPHPPRE